MNKLGGKLYPVLRAYADRESRLGTQTAIRMPLLWCFVPSLHAVLVENWTFHVGADLHGSSSVLCFYSHCGLQMRGLQISLASLMIILVDHPDSTMSQNQRMFGVGRDLYGSSSPTPLPKQGHLEQAAQDLVQAGLRDLTV